MVRGATGNTHRAVGHNHQRSELQVTVTRKLVGQVYDEYAEEVLTDMIVVIEKAVSAYTAQKH